MIVQRFCLETSMESIMNTKKTAFTALALSALSVQSISPAWSSDQTRTNAGDNWAQHVQRQAAEKAGTPAPRASSRRDA